MVDAPPTDGDRVRDDPEPPADDGGEGDPAADAEGGVDRRTLIRILIALALGIPILVELRTVVTLVGSWVRGEDGTTPTPTPRYEAVGIGDELLPETAAVERLERAEVIATDDDTWPFTIVVEVDNGSDRDYRLELGAVTTRDDTVVDGGATSDRIPPGESATLANTWSLPEGESPESMKVRAELGTEDPEVIERDVVLRGIAVQG